MVPPVPAAEQDAEWWARRFTTNATALQSSGIRIADPLQLLVQPPHSAFFCFGINLRATNAAAARAYQAMHPELTCTAPHCETWNARPLRRRLRIGFLTQPTFPLISGIARELDRERFEVVHLFERSQPLTPTSAWQGASDQQVSIPDKNLADARRAVADQHLDILVHTPYTGLRYFLSHARLAPVQCVLCEPAYTDGIPNLDYYISWAPAEPTKVTDYYSSAVALMNRPPYWLGRDYTTPAVLQKADFDLPQDARWYVCPGAPTKMQPRFDPVLAQILAADPQAILILFGRGMPLARIVERRLRALVGSSGDCIRVLPMLPAARCHALLRVADAVIDTWPVGGMSSAFAAIHAGVPTVTLPANVPFGRWLAAMYETIGVRDLIAMDKAHYVRLAVRLAQDPDWRREIGARIKASSAIFIEDRMAVRELELFLLAAVAAAHGGERPRHWRGGRFVILPSRKPRPSLPPASNL